MNGVASIRSGEGESPSRSPNRALNPVGEFQMIDLPRKSIPSRSRENGLRDRVKAGLAGVFRTQRTQVSSSSILPAAGFPAGAGTGSGPGAADSFHCAAKHAGALSRRALCGRTWL